LSSGELPVSLPMLSPRITIRSGSPRRSFSMVRGINVQRSRGGWYCTGGSVAYSRSAQSSTCWSVAVASVTLRMQIV